MARQRLTITLKTDLLKLVDSYIDGQNIRNRSHAVEVLLTKAVSKPSMKVLILAGGEGVKFRPFTYELPKALIPVGGKSLLAHTLEKLAAQGFYDVTLSVGHLGELIKKEFGDGKSFGLRLSYVQQEKNTKGTAQALKVNEKYFNKESFLLLYADVLADVNFHELIDFHLSQQNPIVTMALTSVDEVTDWGLAKMNGSHVVDFEEKPKTPNTKSHLVNAGMYVLDSSIFTFISDNVIRLESDLLPRLAEEGKLFGYPFDGDWHDISTPKVYELVLKNYQ